MIDEQDIIIEELKLHDYNFPNNYVNMAHPEDYKETNEFKPHFTISSIMHSRPIARVAWKTNEGTMIPMSFVCDTGAPSHLYLSKKAIEILESKKLLYEGELGPYVKIHTDNINTFPASVKQIPCMYKNANLIGLNALRKLHFHLTTDEFSFNNKFVYM